jgi:omega-amidase
MPLTISIIQANLHWQNPEANLHQFAETISKIKHCELVVLPEMFNTGFSMQPKLLAETMDGNTVNWMRKIAAEKKIIITGSLIVNDAGKFYNRLIWMLPNGQCAYYDKRHLFAFGGEDKEFSAGNKRLITSVNGFKINLQICYDLRFPVWARQQINSNSCEYDVLIYVANWPAKRIHAWKTLLLARAIENQCYVIGVNRTGTDANGLEYNGFSSIIDPMGQVVHTADTIENVYTYTLQKTEIDAVRQGIPFWKDADKFIIEN